MTKDVRVYLAHILESIDKIERFTMDGKVRFLRDPMVHDAVVRNLEIIGEAAKRVDDAYRTAQPKVPWRALAGLRDVPIHQHCGSRSNPATCFGAFRPVVSGFPATVR